MKIFKLITLFNLSYDLFKYDLGKNQDNKIILSIKAYYSAFKWIVSKNELCFNKSPLDMWKQNQSDDLILFLKGKMGYE
jgi:hypothetical protein